MDNKIKVKRILLVRHGEADHNVMGSYGGWSNTSLTTVGLVQAQATAPIVAKLTADWNATLYSSDTQRARHTAGFIAEQTRQELITDWRLREFHTGVASVISEEELTVNRPLTHPVAAWRPYLASESWGMFAHRVYDFMDDITVKDCIIVTHAGTCFNIMLWWLGIGDDGLGKVFFNMENCGVTQLDYNKYGERQVSFSNRIYY